jgi:transcriptional regulator with XRE-family HTH domain
MAAEDVEVVERALGSLVEELRKRQGWTMEKLAEVAQLPEQAVQRVLEAPSDLRSGDVTLRALSSALRVDAWLLERAAASPKDNVGELLRLTDQLSGGAASRVRRLAGSAVPDSLDQAVRMARQSVSPAKQLELAHLITLFTAMAPHDREFLLALAARLADGPHDAT